MAWQLSGLLEELRVEEPEGGVVEGPAELMEPVELGWLVGRVPVLAQAPVVVVQLVILGSRAVRAVPAVRAMRDMDRLGTSLAWEGVAIKEGLPIPKVEAWVVPRRCCSQSPSSPPSPRVDRRRL